MGFNLAFRGLIHQIYDLRVEWKGESSYLQIFNTLKSGLDFLFQWHKI